MFGAGIALLLLGVALLVAEAHLTSAGVLGASGVFALAAGAVLVVLAGGGVAWVAFPVGVGIGAVAGAALIVAGHKTAVARRGRLRSGYERLVGSVGTARTWTDSHGLVYVDGALWRAHETWADPELDEISAGDPVVIEEVQGLTLSVRKADPLELMR